MAGDRFLIRKMDNPSWATMKKMVRHPQLVGVERADRVDGHGDRMSSVVKRSIIRGGHKSSVSLEDQFWEALREIADQRKLKVSELVAKIDQSRTNNNLSSAIRVFVLGHFRAGKPHEAAQGLKTQETDPVSRHR
jgi:predicted DNA-binding ribbon-helix-helix protein